MYARTQDIPVFLTYVRSEYLHNSQDSFGLFSPATVYGISSCKDNLFFHLLIDDTKNYNNIPVESLSNSKNAPVLQREKTCNYLDEEIQIFQFDYLLNIGKCTVHNSDGSLFQAGSYVFTVEYSSGYVIHLIELDDGNYMFCDNSLLNWKN